MDLGYSMELTGIYITYLFVSDLRSVIKLFDYRKFSEDSIKTTAFIRLQMLVNCTQTSIFAGI